MAILAPLQMWRPPFNFPICITVTEEQLADVMPSILITKADDAKPANIKFCWEDRFKLSITKTNIAKIEIMMGECFRHVARYLRREIPGVTVPPEIPTIPPEWTPERLRDEAVRYVKSTCDRFDVEITSDVKEEDICFVLPTAPTEWRFKGILKEGAPVPFTVTDTNKVCFHITHTSPTLITIQLLSDTTATMQATTSTIASIMVLFIIVYLVRTIITTIKAR